jgi:hypothetical protein
MRFGKPDGTGERRTYDDLVIHDAKARKKYAPIILNVIKTMEMSELHKVEKFKLSFDQTSKMFYIRDFYDYLIGADNLKDKDGDKFLEFNKFFQN